MTQFSLVLPFALPPKELAPDLIRALQAPSLATLITRARRRSVATGADLRTLPYESSLARELGISNDGRPAFASAVMHGFGLDGTGGTWFILAPTHIEVARSHLLLHDTRSLRLSEAHARALFDIAKPYFDESGKTLLYGDAGTWFMRADDWAGLDTASPDAVVGLNVADFMPLGARAIEYRRLQNEIQMLWFGHPANAEREARGQAAVNGFWPWGASAASTMPARPVAASGAPAWLAALAGATPATVDALLASGQDPLLVCAEPLAPALASDWSSWLAQMQHLEHTVFTPLLAHLRAGRVRSLRLVLSHRTEQIEFTTSALSLRAFWRRPTLNSLLP